MNDGRYRVEIRYSRKCTFMSNLKFYGIFNYLKNLTNFRKIWDIVQKLHTNIIYRSRTVGIEFGSNRLKRSNFFRFWIFSKFALNCQFVQISSYRAKIFCSNAVNVSYEIRWESVEVFKSYRLIWIFYFFYRDIKFWKFDVSTKLPLWGCQNQTT